MIDPTTESGERVMSRLRDDLVAWLVTVRPDGTPMPTPVWFWWDGETMLVYSEEGKPKLRNIEANPHVAVALRTDRVGSDLAVITGDAVIDRSAPPADAHRDYIAKYRSEITRLGSDPSAFAAAYSVPIRITSTRVRAE
ncbi:MAG: TIGR03667 family PPOX class F420-dependent oxidoreductase [Chloroflexi bacterium]|nr:TIGR03667 family PPOX class F420-dependent oxidoreductase [Chloroflexota bacterium]